MVFLVSVSFLTGLFLGRYLNRSEVRISRSKDTATATTSATATSTRATVSVPSGADTENEPTPQPDSNGSVININTATALELATLPGIGDVIAQRIVDYRNAHGSFRTVGELTAVEGIGEKRLNAILAYITVGG